MIHDGRDPSYQRWRRQQIAYGTWEPWAEAEPIRRHIAYLRRNGLSLPTIAEAAGLSLSTVASVVYPRHGRLPEQVKTYTAHRLLSVSRTTGYGLLVDATGTRRRIQALAAMGWTIEEQARRIGISVSNLHHSLANHRVTIYRAREVKEVYDYWHMSVGPSDYARTRARRKGWPPPMAWDEHEIDDPMARPKFGCAS